jgi:hypothetical protein
VATTKEAATLVTNIIPRSTRGAAIRSAAPSMTPGVISLATGTFRSVTEKRALLHCHAEGQFRPDHPFQRSVIRLQPVVEDRVPSDGSGGAAWLPIRARRTAREAPPGLTFLAYEFRGKRKNQLRAGSAFIS